MKCPYEGCGEEFLNQDDYYSHQDWHSILKANDDRERERARSLKGEQREYDNGVARLKRSLASMLLKQWIIGASGPAMPTERITEAFQSFWDFSVPWVNLHERELMGFVRPEDGDDLRFGEIGRFLYGDRGLFAPPGDDPS